tara:strand:+ start:134 stop:865 length:732 start_codon:yes stop_codon:yes gene_type:complete
MKIALLLPTRERMNLKLSFLCSALTRCKDPDNFTIYFGIDRDDPTLERCRKLEKVITNLKIVEFEPMGKDTNIHQLWNILAKESTEEIISMVGDDMIFTSENWDEVILNEFKDGEKFKLVYGNDGFRDGTMCVNAFVHRFYYETTGYFLREDFIRNWADQWLYQIFKAFDRLIYKPDLMIKHNHWVFGAMHKDKVAMELQAREGKNKERSDQMWSKTTQDRVDEIKMWAEKLNLEPDFETLVG